MFRLYGCVASFVREKTLISSALSGFVAQPCRHRSEICATKSPQKIALNLDKEAQKARKSPEIAHFCSALPCKVTFVVGICRRAYSCNKIGRGLSILTFCIQPDFCVVNGDWHTCSLSSSNRHTGRSCGLHGDITAERRRTLTRRFRICSRCHLITIDCISYIFFLSVSNSLALFNLLMVTNI